MSIEAAAPIQRRPLHNVLADRLRHMIVEGELAPGEKLIYNFFTVPIGPGTTSGYAAYSGA